MVKPASLLAPALTSSEIVPRGTVFAARPVRLRPRQEERLLPHRITSIV